MALLDDVLRLFGTSRIKLAWRWRRLKTRLSRQRSALENRGQALTYAHQTCPACHHPAAADDQVCTRCGARLLGATRQRAGRLLNVLVPEGVPLVTVAVMATSAALFLVVEQLGRAIAEQVDNGDLGRTLALYRHGSAMSMAISAGEWWRLVTAMFLHAGGVHILMNGIGMWIAGTAMEELFGRSRTAVAFVVTGLCGNLATFAWRLLTSPGSTVGASGAVLGLIGVLLGHAVRHRRGRGRELRARFLPFAIYSVVIGFLIGADNAAHLGGLVSGFVIGLLLGDRQTARRAPAWLWNLAALACVALVAAAFYFAQRYGAVPLA